MAGEFSAKSMKEWLRFMVDAGIPPKAAADYACNFADNRIEMDMIHHLDKDYLKELGVSKLGDIIGILTHVKKLQAETPSEPPAAKSVRSSDKPRIKVTTSAKHLQPSAVGKVIGHYFAKGDKPTSSTPKILNMRKVSPQPAVQEQEDDEDEYDDDYESIEDIDSRVGDELQQEAVSDNDTPQVTPDVTPIQSKTSVESRRRVTAPTANVSPSLKEVIPVQRKRRVLPEHEGKYKVKMPSGTTIKTAKLAAEGKLARRREVDNVQVIEPEPKSSGIFGRLDLSKEVATKFSSTAAQKPTVASATLASRLNKQSPQLHFNKQASKTMSPKISFTVTGLRNVDPSNISASGKSAASDQVFNRLGVNRRPIKRPATSTQPDLDLLDEPASEVGRDSVPYVGVLKDGGKHNAKHKRIEVSDDTQFNRVTIKQDGIKSRLGKPRKEVQVTRTIESTTVDAGSVKGRLGAPADPTVTSTTGLRLQTSIKSRLNRKKFSLVKKSNTDEGAGGVFSRLGRPN